MLKVLKRSAVLSLAFLAVAAPGRDAAADPGSILVFPFFDNSQQARTIVTVTNTNTSRVFCDFREGDVIVRFRYVDSSGCVVTDRSEFLTPGDTFSTRTDQHYPVAGAKGWLWVEALDPETNRAIDFDYLTGSAYLGHEKANLKWWYTPYSFRSFIRENGAPFGVSSCGHAFVDTGSSAGTADFNGLEYEGFPKKIQLDTFIGEGAPPELGGNTVDSRLYLLSTNPAGTRVTMLVYNNNETLFSRLLLIGCTFEATLSSISVLFLENNLRSGYDAGELGGLPTGWFEMAGDAGVLGLFVERITRADGKLIQVFGRPLTSSGTRTDVKLGRGL